MRFHQLRFFFFGLTATSFSSNLSLNLSLLTSRLRVGLCSASGDMGVAGWLADGNLQEQKPVSRQLSNNQINAYSSTCRTYLFLKAARVCLICG